MSKWSRQIMLFLIGGLSYYNIEILWRGYSHISMLLCGGCCFVSVGKMAQLLKKIPFVIQMFIGSLSITVIEFITGLIVNQWLKLGVWNYSDMWGNIMGQVCPMYSLFWFFLSAPCIKVYNWIEEIFCNKQEMPFKI